MLDLLLAAALSMTAQATAAPPQAAPSSLDWMSGAWRTATDPVASGPAFTEEVWSSVQGQMLIGYSRTIARFRVDFFEYMRIARDQDGTTTLYVLGEAGPAVPFRLVRSGQREAVFENRAHDYPQRIAYRREGNQLTGTISLADGTRSRSWAYRRVGGD